jgi:hypothetical protein
MADGVTTVLEAARRLAAGLESDIVLCRTRDEHVRVTARANEARGLLDGLEDALGGGHDGG